MVSIGPYTQSYDYTHMYDLADMYCEPCIKLTSGSIMEFLSKNKEYSNFAKIVHKAQLENNLNNINCNCTLFVPSNTVLKNIDDIDIHSARNFVMYSMVQGNIDSDVLKTSPKLYLHTRNKPHKILVESVKGGGIILDNKAKIVKHDIKLVNGMIHVIDNVL